MRSILQNVKAFDLDIKTGYQWGSVRQTITATYNMAFDQPVQLNLSAAATQTVVLPSITGTSNPNTQDADRRVHVISNVGAFGTGNLSVVAHADDGSGAVTTISPGQTMVFVADKADTKWNIIGGGVGGSNFGGGAGTFLPEGNLNVSVPGVTNGILPGGTGADNVLFSFSIPAGSFDRAGRGVNVVGAGNFAANGNTKTVKLIFNPASATVGSTVGTGGVTISSSGAVTQNGGAWLVSGQLFKRGAAGSNTQVAIPGGAILSGSHVGLSAAVQEVTATESGAILVAVTGNATTATADIIGSFFEVNAMD